MEYFKTSNYFSELSHWLKVEQNEDQAQHLAMIQGQSATQRRLQGYTWYPVAIRSQEHTSADYLKVELERTTHQDIEHQFKTGVPVRFFSNHDEKIDFLKGAILHVGPQKMTILFKTDELPDWASQGKLGVDMLFDEGSYKSMFGVLTLLDKYLHNTAKKEKIALVDAIFNHKISADYNTNLPIVWSRPLNTSQQQAVMHMLTNSDLTVVHGPPGTGKTSTLVEGMLQMIKKGAKKILVTAASNMAVDNLAQRLHEAGLNVVRIGSLAKVSESLQTLTLEAKANSFANQNEIKRLKKQASEYQNMAHKYKRNFGRAEREQRKALFDEAYKLLTEVDKLKSYGTEQVLQQAQVICTTLVASDTQLPKDMRFDAVIIDEAGQAIEPMCWIPIQRAPKLILAGDHQQLPPTIKSAEVQNQGFSTTLFEKLAVQFPANTILLNTQYRMNTQIMGCINEAFYEGKLQASETVASQTFAQRPAVTFVDTAGAGFDEELEGTSSKNEKEVEILFKLLQNELENLNVPISIGIISPYRTQIELLKTNAKQANFISSAKVKDLKINTVDSFQGQEADLVLISLVRSNDKGEIGFLADLRRINVALSRARKRLIIIGDSATISYHGFYAGLLDYIDKGCEYKSVYEFIE